MEVDGKTNYGSGWQDKDKDKDNLASMNEHFI